MLGHRKKNKGKKVKAKSKKHSQTQKDYLERFLPVFARSLDIFYFQSIHFYEKDSIPPF